MKTFDIEAYNKKKKNPGYDGYYLKDSTYIRQFDAGGDGIYMNYIEVITHPTNFFQEYRVFHHNGKIKIDGLKFFNDFEKGIWKEYDEQGNLVKETDYDAPYKFTWEDVLKLIKERKLDMTGNNFEVGRNIVDKRPVWSIIFNIKNSDKLGVIGIYGDTGEIFQESEMDAPADGDYDDE
ncbi:hypothetical protein HN014_19925 [Aquimarina sp. TRL1]|uniref:hypothetical protein n=1 Tax=Aquimarina sp. (strain TRL1) TaxID=2736252 RepID=UPI00158D2F95|nr:hypothetical protein [Aquimarina sp. TRL1]QKX07086.1 hypothetical protein HN014_19925 [Aquimarina sp. TRL1]